MRLKVLFLIPVMLLLTFQLMGQKSKKNKRDKDVEIIDFGDDGGQGETDPYGDFIIKTNPFSYMFGWQFVEVERTIAPFFTVQGGLGVTFKPLLQDTYAEFIDELREGPNYESEWSNDYPDDYSDYSIRSQKIGLLYSANFKLYFDDDAPDGSYFGFTARIANKRYEVQKVDETYTGGGVLRLPNDFQDEKVRNLDLVGYYGYQLLYDKLTTEYFVGLGARLSKHTRQDIGSNSSFGYKNGEIEFKESLVRYEVGVRIGFQL